MGYLARLDPSLAPEPQLASPTSLLYVRGLWSLQFTQRVEHVPGLGRMGWDGLNHLHRGSYTGKEPEHPILTAWDARLYPPTQILPSTQPLHRLPRQPPDLVRHSLTLAGLRGPGSRIYSIAP